MNEQDQEAVLGHSHLVLALLHCSVDAKNYVNVVVDSVGVVMGREGVFCIDRKGGCCGGGSGGCGWGERHRSGSGALLLGGLLWKRLFVGGMVA